MKTWQGKIRVPYTVYMPDEILLSLSELASIVTGQYLHDFNSEISDADISRHKEHLEIMKLQGDTRTEAIDLVLDEHLYNKLTAQKSIPVFISLCITKYLREYHETNHIERYSTIKFLHGCYRSRREDFIFSSLKNQTAPYIKPYDFDSSQFSFPYTGQSEDTSDTPD
jgi:hypothetical protein